MAEFLSDPKHLDQALWCQVLSPAAEKFQAEVRPSQNRPYHARRVLLERLEELGIIVGQQTFRNLDATLLTQEAHPQLTLHSCLLSRDVVAASIRALGHYAVTPDVDSPHPYCVYKENTPRGLKEHLRDQRADVWALGVLHRFVDTHNPDNGFVQVLQETEHRIAWEAQQRPLMAQVLAKR